MAGEPHQLLEQPSRALELSAPRTGIRKRRAHLGAGGDFRGCFQGCDGFVDACALDEREPEEQARRRRTGIELETVPELALGLGEIVSETSMRPPDLVLRTVSKCSTRSPRRIR